MADAVNSTTAPAIPPIAADWEPLVTEAAAQAAALNAVLVALNAILMTEGGAHV